MWKSTAPNRSPVPKGTLLVIGGNEDKGLTEEPSDKEDDNHGLEILKAFIKLTEKEDPVIEIITSAAGEGKEMFEDYQKAFKQINIERLGHIHHALRKEVLEDDLSERVQQADAFFFTGGDQLILTSIYGGTPFLTSIKERYIADKIVIGGTSAGAMAMSTPMIYAGNKNVQQIAGEIKITTGLEFLKDVCIDTHFIDRSRFIRMAQVIATNPTCIGIGIEEDTAIIVRDGSKAEVIGNSIVTVIEGFFISNSNITEYADNCLISIQDLRVHLLSRGSNYGIPQINPPHK